MTSNDMSFYPQINVDFNPHQKVSFKRRCQLTHYPTISVQRELHKTQPYGTSISYLLFPGLRDHCEKGGQNNCKSPRQWMTTMKQYF